MQKTSGIHRILSNPWVYNFVQFAFSAHKSCKKTIKQLNLNKGDTLLDIGCGTAFILDYLSDIKYFGLDISAEYISAANSKYSGKGIFTCGILNASMASKLPKFDAILLQGVLHHLTDQEINDLFALSKKILKPGGKIVTVDPCFLAKQNVIARFFVRQDRGKNVKTQAGYVDIAKVHFENMSVEIEHQKLPPYDRCRMTLSSI